ncbi:hypothetical protein NsoK4_03520 [Nitrosopumilus sp. K4]|uniref:hypothetical protein n=1 Tax=Nitrosopumilus sp. K4 TaxID=2795383 RepID=UPI001BADE212|nr:hypothetical protein [Nitrosopumilus sp. K4]QUC65327.1 hypothetical protein NsoK4_03520 [Nitrosopumilus sp. K4]
MAQVCIRCGIELQDLSEKFCSKACQEEHFKYLKNLMMESIAKDKNHTSNLAYCVIEE